MKRKILKLKTIILQIFFLIMNKSIIFATAPDRSKVEAVASDGIDLFFGSLAGIAVVLGGIEFVQAFLAYRENEEEGGSAEANSKVGRKILAGVLCLVGAVIVFTIMNWTKTLFNLD